LSVLCAFVTLNKRLLTYLIVVTLSIGGFVQHVRSRCTCSGVWHLRVSAAKSPRSTAKRSSDSKCQSIDRVKRWIAATAEVWQMTDQIVP